MPQKQKSKIDGEAVFGILFIGTLVTAIYFLLSGIFEKDRENRELAAEALSEQLMQEEIEGRLLQRGIEIDGITYSLIDAHQISTTEGAVEYEMNFHTETVIIDGPGDVYTMEVFTEFNNSAQIDDNRTAGLQIAQHVLETNETLAESDMAHIKDIEEYQDLVSDAEIFTRVYGPDNTEQDNPEVQSPASASPSPGS